MGHARTLSMSLSGIDGTLVEVEADVASGLPAFVIVGLPDSSMLQARERVRAALSRSGLGVAPRRLTINLTPAWHPKHGSGFDLAMAVAIADAQGELPGRGQRRTLHLGELGLDGRVRPIPGVLAALVAAREQGIEQAVVPLENMAEARLVDGISVHGAGHLRHVLHRWGAAVDPDGAVDGGADGSGGLDAGADTDGGTSADGGARPQHAAHGPIAPGRPVLTPDFRDVVGQRIARRAAEIAAAGAHHLLMTGPPGAGKTMIASRLPGLLPDLDADEALAVSAIHSLSGRFDPGDGLLRRPPYEAPHHTASTAAMVGGGSGIARPGAISRAHAGVLFLDEAPEFSARVLEALREPLETGDITLHRQRHVSRYPARFQLVMAANPCPCGMSYGRGDACRCTPQQQRRYRSRLSGPVRDRIDMHVDVPPADVLRVGTEEGESTAAIARRVACARDRQRERFADLPWRLNSQIPAPELHRRFAPEPAEKRLLDRRISQGAISLRGYDRVVRIAWTIADLAGEDRPGEPHVGEALHLRGEDIR
ncbi:YifB family Mg chelatase-like AAA ATPase [Brachybacterium sp. DNPG3]